MRKLFYLFFFVYSTFVHGQTENEMRLTIGYYGETIAHPGLNAGIEFGSPIGQRRQMFVAVNMGGYVHPRNNTSLFLRTQWGQRFELNSGLFFESLIGIGYLHQFTHGGKIYTVQPNGAIIKNPNLGRPQFMPSLVLGTGWHCFKNKKRELSVHLRPELFWKAPFNGYFLTHFALNVGVNFKLK